MPLAAGAYSLGPDAASLTVKTGRTGVAAKAGHDLLIDVTSWEALLKIGEAAGETSIDLTVDAKSLHVREGVGGMQALGDEDKANIEQTIDDEVLKGTPIRFRSTEVTPSADGRGLRVQGELELAGEQHPISFELTVDRERLLRGSALLKQSDWGLKPYSALLGTLKVVDEVEVLFEAPVPVSRPPDG